MDSTIPLHDGNRHPAIGFGTYKVGFVPASASAAGGVGSATGADVREVVKAAVSNGYRCVDCAQYYENEKLVGEAIQASGIAREQLYLISKVWNNTIFEGPEAVRKQFYQTLADLKTNYVDLYLLHWPVPGKHVDCWKVLEDLKREGKVKSIGISNYTVEDYLDLKKAVDPKTGFLPVVNQLEVNPFCFRKRTIEFFQKEKIVIQAYRPLRNGAEMKNPKLTNIASKYKHSHSGVAVTVAQILGRWCVQKGFVYLPKSEKPARIAENKEVFDFQLSSEDMDALDALTTQENIDLFYSQYAKCVLRDTPWHNTEEAKKLIKTEVTKD